MRNILPTALAVVLTCITHVAAKVPQKTLLQVVTPVLKSRLDAIEGIDGCDDLEDATTALATRGSGTPLYVSFDLGGIWSYDDAAGHRPIVVGTPIVGAIVVHPDGALVFATATAAGTRTAVNLYKVSPSRAASAASSDTAVALVATSAFGGALNDVLPPALAADGTIAFTLPSSPNDTCGAVGLIALGPQPLLSF